MTPERVRFDVEAAAVLAPAMGRAYRAIRRELMSGGRLRLVDDPELWGTVREAMRRAYVQVWLVSWQLGQDRGRALVLSQKAKDGPGQIDRAALSRWWAAKPRTEEETFRAALSFDAWWDKQEPARKLRVQQAVIDADRLGKGPRWIAAQIKGDWSPARAEQIARDAATNTIGLAQQASFRAAGVEMWSWSTVNDRRVCPACDGLDESVHPMSEPFAGAHSRCRCGPVPAAATVATRG